MRRKMATITFDTLAYTNRLEQAGVPREQAEALAKANAEAFTAMADTRQLATKQDIERIGREFEARLADTKHEILKWVMGMIMGPQQR